MPAFAQDQGLVGDGLDDINDERFKKTFRISKDTFSFIFIRIGNDLERQTVNENPCRLGIKLMSMREKLLERVMRRFMNYHNVCIWFGTRQERRMNHLPFQCRIMRQTLSNLTFLPHQIKTSVPN